MEGCILDTYDDDDGRRMRWLKWMDVDGGTVATTRQQQGVVVVGIVIGSDPHDVGGGVKDR